MQRDIQELEVEPHEGKPKPTVTSSGGPCRSIFFRAGLTRLCLNGPRPQSSMSIAFCIHRCSTHFLFQESPESYTISFTNISCTQNCADIEPTPSILPVNTHCVITCVMCHLFRRFASGCISSCKIIGS